MALPLDELLERDGKKLRRRGGIRGRLRKQTGQKGLSQRVIRVGQPTRSAEGAVKILGGQLRGAGNLVEQMRNPVGMGNIVAHPRHFQARFAPEQAALDGPRALLARRERAELDPVAIRILHIKLMGAVGTDFARPIGNLAVVQVILPGVEVIDEQREVIAPMVRMHGLIPVADQMQFLIGSQPEPCAGKVEGGSRHCFQLQHLAIEAATGGNVGDVQRHVIELGDAHDCQVAEQSISTCSVYTPHALPAWRNREAKVNPRDGGNFLLRVSDTGRPLTCAEPILRMLFIL
jgi:hypothetical protein